MPANALTFPFVSFTVLVLASCALTPGPAKKPTVPKPDPAAARVPDGFRVEVAFEGLMYPSSIEFDDEGRIYVAECGYMPGDTSQPPRILRFEADGGGRSEIARAGLIAPVTDLLWHDGKLWISHKTKVSVLDGGKLRDVVTELPSLGDHSNNQLAIGPDGKLYVGIGTATNAGVVGPDNFAFGWPKEHPEVCEVPAKDIVLTGEVFDSEDPRRPGATARTSAYQPFGRTVPAGTVVRGRTKANGAILRVALDGSGLEVYAWGFRNPYGLLWSDGRLYCADAGSDERGSRHIANAPEKLWVVEKDGFYGWPDYVIGKPATDAAFTPAKRSPPRPLWQEHPEAKQPWLTFEPHASATQIDVCRNPEFAPPGLLFVGSSGDQSAVTAAEEVRAGYWVKSVDPRTAIPLTFFTARAEALGPEGLEYVETAGPRRIVDVRFDRGGRSLYLVDIGPIHYVTGDQGPQPVAFPGTGVIWRIVRTE
jgi:glucose/arabinose dehydrogenase